MKVALVSFHLDTIVNYDNLLIKDINKDFVSFKNIILNPDYNLIIFPGWSLNKNKLKELELFIESSENQKILQNKLVVFEVYDNENEKYKDYKDLKDIIKKKDIIEKDEENKEEDKKRLIYIIKKGELINTNLVQLFHDGNVDDNKINELLEQIKNSINNPIKKPNRIIKYDNKKILVLICGEILVIKGSRNDTIYDIRVLSQKDDFDTYLSQIDIIINIVHTTFEPRTNRDGYKKYLSKKYTNNKERYYLSTCNNKNFSNENLLQYIFRNEEIQRLTPVVPETDYLLQTFDI